MKPETVSAESPPVVKDTMDNPPGVTLETLHEKILQLERLVRGAGRDSLSAVQAQQELKTDLQALGTKLDDAGLDIKGITQALWRLSQDDQQHAKDMEEHYAGALRDLEKRIREEINLQVYRGVMRALLPALDDMDLVVTQQAKLHPDGGDDFYQGIRLVRQKFAQGLREMGFEEIPVEPGKTQYDPTQQDVVEVDIPPSFLDNESITAGSILFLRRKGYTFNGRLFRAPQVFIKS